MDLRLICVHDLIYWMRKKIRNLHLIIIKQKQNNNKINIYIKLNQQNQKCWCHFLSSCTSTFRRVLIGASSLQVPVKQNPDVILCSVASKSVAVRVGRQEDCYYTVVNTTQPASQHSVTSVQIVSPWKCSDENQNVIQLLSVLMWKFNLFIYSLMLSCVLFNNFSRMWPRAAIKCWLSKIK